MKKTKIIYLAQLSLLVAIIILMNFTPLGYLRIAMLEITFITIPVAVGAITLGPVAGAFLGTVFGVTSFIQCFGTSAFGATLLNINPLYTLALCLVPRILAGFIGGLIFMMLKNTKLPSCTIAAFACPILNSIFFMSALVGLFYNTEYIQGFATALGTTNPVIFAILFVGVQGIVEALVCGFSASLISKALLKVLNIKKPKTDIVTKENIAISTDEPVIPDSDGDTL